MKKPFNGKAIYNPSGKAGEQSHWACNFYTGCSNDCDYCYCKKGYLGLFWTNKPQLKKCFKDVEDAFRIFSSELERNMTDLREEGIFFTFTSDPMLPDTMPLTLRCVDLALEKGVAVQILTKRAEFVGDDRWQQLELDKRKMIAFGFTLTGCDDLEPGASSNQERMDAMRKLHDLGYHTFASIEPVVDPVSSMKCIQLTADCCDLFKVGLMSGKKNYVYKNEIKDFQTKHACRFYLKDSFVSFLNTDRETLGNSFVRKDYNIFKPNDDGRKNLQNLRQ